MKNRHQTKFWLKILNTFFFFVGCVYKYNLSNKKVCVYMCVGGGCLDKYISVVTWSPQTKIPNFTPGWLAINNNLSCMLDSCDKIVGFYVKY